jgi:hypothetical protein
MWGRFAQTPASIGAIVDHIIDAAMEYGQQTGAQSFVKCQNLPVTARVSMGSTECVVTGDIDRVVLPCEDATAHGKLVQTNITFVSDERL